MLKRFEDLTLEQQEVVSVWGRGQAVMAGAGSGKTTTLVIKCEELMKRNPKARFAAVSFTEKSASELRAKLSERGLIDEEQGRHWVTTIHGLCASILREFPRAAGFDGEEAILTESEAEVLWKQAIDSLWFGNLQPSLEESLERLLGRESRSGLISLLGRVKAIQGFGALDRLPDDADSRALAEVGRFVLGRYESLKRRRGLLDFDDLERAADLILEEPSGRVPFQKRFDLVLVDEFQDTNPVQARILTNFVKPDLSNLCVVGDPKQSIYRFRDADVTTFDECCAKMPVRQALTWNFRSRPAVIEFVNELCAPLFDASGLRYEPLVPKREPNPDEPSPVVKLQLEDPSQLPNWIRSQQERGVALGDIAILLRKIRGNEKWLKPLVASKIPLVVGSGGFFWEDPRIQECVAALSWWDHPANSLSAATFLRAPWVGIEDSMLDRWGTEDPTFLKPFLGSEHPVAAILRPFLTQAVSPGDFLLKLLEIPGAEGEIGMPLLSLWHRAEELSLMGMDFHEVVREFRRAIGASRREADIPPPQNSGQIRILTVHGSKGLEFPIVILADFSGPWRGRGAPLLFWDRGKGAFLAGRSEDGKRLDKDDPVETEFRLDEKAKELCESKRLFYVALTRAQERLVLALPRIEERKSEKKGDKNPLLEDHWRLWVDSLSKLGAVEGGQPTSGSNASSTLSDAAAESGLERTGCGSLRVALRRPRHSVTEWTVLARCPRAYEWTYIRPPEVQRDFVANLERVHPEPQEMDARKMGTEVHSILERAEFLPRATWLEELRVLSVAAGKERLDPDRLASWIDSSSWMKSTSLQKVWSELGFEVPIRMVGGGEAVLIGSMDRLVRVEKEGQAQYTILDFKVTSREKPKAELMESYQLQLALYGWALGRLEPEAQGRTQALILNIHPGGVQELEVELPEWTRRAEEGEALLQEWATQANHALNEPGAPANRGAHCLRCRWNDRCNAASG